VSKFKVEFQLKQHTPIIHFQADQNGATLRATELKPKFDKFLLERAKEIPFKENANGSRSLDYKVAIEQDYTSAIEIKERDPLFFGNMGDGEMKKFKQQLKNFKITFFSFDFKVLEAIKEHFEAFLANTNFGTRQNKGFGSFTTSDTTKDKAEKLLLKYSSKLFSLGACKDYKDGFKKIDSFYKRLKAGTNRPYKKSLLFQYMCNTYGIGWEKRFIKKSFPEVVHGNHNPITCKDNDKELRYIRAVLGLAEHNEYRPKSGKKQVKIKSVDDIDRFQSPITFKIINNFIYVIFNESYKNILNKEFEFILNGKPPKSLKTPEQFDLYDFLKYATKQEKNFSEILA